MKIRFPSATKLLTGFITACSRLTLHGEISSLRCENHARDTNALCGQTAEFRNFQAGVSCNWICALNSQRTEKVFLWVLFKSMCMLAVLKRWNRQEEETFLNILLKTCYYMLIWDSSSSRHW